jgi:hypothetical protein
VIVMTPRTPSAYEFSRALRETRKRYINFMMSKPTHDSHMKTLWARIDRAGLRDAVTDYIPADEPVRGIRR